jgi:type I restriction enzyme S subunit
MKQKQIEKLKNIPKLRFPEFLDAGDWEERKLEEFLTESRVIGNKGDISKKITVKLWGKGVFKKEEILKGSPNTQYYQRKAGQFIYSKLDFLNQAFGIIPSHLDGFESTLDLPCFDIHGEINPVFLLEYVKRKSFYGKFGEIADGGRKAKRIQVEIFLSFPIILSPTYAEQQKIADCLTSIDDRITAETQKLATLKAHKKGLMQQLFPAEGETLPKLRFPEFHDAGEWELKALQSFCKVGDIDHKMPSSVADGIPYIMTGDFCGINNINFDNAKKISTEDYEQLSKKIRPEFGDIVIARYASVGAVRYIETNIKFLVSYSCAIIKCDKSQNSRYLYYVFQSDIIQSNIGLEINMSSQKNIGIDSIKKLNIFLPTLPEQEKIADCLTSIDDLIAAQTQKIATLKTHKKGLMQQLFPSV